MSKGLVLNVVSEISADTEPPMSLVVSGGAEDVSTTATLPGEVSIVLKSSSKVGNGEVSSLIAWTGSMSFR